MARPKRDMRVRDRSRRGGGNPGKKEAGGKQRKRPSHLRIETIAEERPRERTSGKIDACRKGGKVYHAT